LSKFWSGKKLSDVTAANCRAYCHGRTPAAARRDLEVLCAAIKHWNRHHGPLPLVLEMVLPDKPERRERWMTRSRISTNPPPPVNIP
jgi:hypothetical protein